MKKYVLVAVSAAFSSSLLATNGYQLIGIGTYQKSLGGAVTAKPGSAMAAITNPAGMARIGKRADFSMELFQPERSVDFSAIGGAQADSASELYGIPSLGWTAPISDENDDVFFGGGIYGTSGLGADYPLTLVSPAGGFGPGDVYFSGFSAIQFWQMAPTLAWNHSDTLSFGLSLNINYQSASLKQSFSMDTTTDGLVNPDVELVNTDLSRVSQAFGYGFTVGLIYDVSDDFTFGLSYKSKQSFSPLEYQLNFADIQGNPNLGVTTGCANEVCPAGTYELDLEFPAIMSLGFSYSPTDALTISYDHRNIRWSDTLNDIRITGEGSMMLSLPTGWENQSINALGIEYKVSESFFLRMGYNEADAPINEADVANNYILPATSTEHYTLGAEFQINKQWGFAFHYMKAPNQTLRSNNPAFLNTSIALETTTFGINLSYQM
ncbi:MAG: outer membrane protein transport protein [Kangiellaceae bacterium]|jgi:long-chain fatty acid transport protein|nr:outer membrane protein transport protein [Kangiellaceae bacterium]